MRGIWVWIAVAVIARGSVWAQSTAPDDNAAVIYSRAAKIIRADDSRNIMSPAASNLTFSPNPPMSEEWIRVEKEDYDRHESVREMVHQGAMLTQAKWPAFNRQNLSYLNECRNLTNEIVDAAVYQGLILHDEPAAFESAGDVLHMAELLKNQPGENLVRLLVAEGIETADMNRLMLVMTGMKITEDANSTNDLQLATAKDWIVRLMDFPDAQAELDQALKSEPGGSANNPILKPSLTRILETIYRLQAERGMTAMVLGAHVYRSGHGRWPESLDELKTELPRVMVDPWGDGKETLGYVLIKGGLPDGGDRPLVYSRCLSVDGLFFRTDRPEFGFYNLPKKAPGMPPMQGGEFRDIVTWTRGENKAAGPATQPLPS